MTLPATIGRLESEIAEGLFTRGAQAWVSHDGETVLDVAMGDDGLGRAVAPQTLFRVYCTIKPVTALAVANLVGAGVLDLDDPLAERLPSVAGVRGGVTARHVLSHTAGMHRPSGVTIEMIPTERRAEVVERQDRPPGWRVGRDAGYSEYGGWHLLGRLLETATGDDLRDHLRGAVLNPLGMNDTFIGMTADQYEATSGRIGVNLDMRALRTFAMLFERTERVCRETNCAHGGYTTARDLGALYRSLLRAGSGETVPGLPSADLLAELCRPARPAAFDVVLDRECGYGLGFMTGLADHHFGPDCSAGSYGHSGNVGSSFAFADPVHDLAVAVVFNGIVDHESAFVRRPALVRAIYRDLGLGLVTGDVDDRPDEPAVPRRHRWRRRG